MYGENEAGGEGSKTLTFPPQNLRPIFENPGHDASSSVTPQTLSKIFYMTACCLGESSRFDRRIKTTNRFSHGVRTLQ